MSDSTFAWEGKAMSEEKILFIDNVPDFLNTRKEFLEDKGYEVLPACSPEEAKRILRTTHVDLAIIDIRLRDDKDELDRSGLELARKMDPAIPKLFLTAFPEDWQLVREALKPDERGFPLALDFLAKREGPEVMLSAVEFALRWPATLRKTLLESFGVASWGEMVSEAQRLSPQETGQRIEKASIDAAKQLESDYKEARTQATLNHRLGLGVASGGMLIILVSAALIGWLGQGTPAVITAVVGAICEGVGLLFFQRVDTANRRTDDLHAEMIKIYGLKELLTACDSLSSSQDRDRCKQEVIREITRWLTGQPLSSKP